MKINKSHFWYNKRQQNGILFLVLIIVALQYCYFFIDFNTFKSSSISSEENHQIAMFQSQIDSLKAIEIENRKPKIYPFNPSFLTDYRASKLGMSTKQIDKLLAHRKAGKYINSATQFQQVTGISDSLLNTIKPYFKFPDWVIQKNKKQQKNKRNIVSNEAKKYSEKSKTKTIVSTTDLNKATAKDFKSINGIGEKLSVRIVKFRNSLGGFINEDQLKEVYGLKKEVVLKLLEKFSIQSKPQVKKININTATFKQVLHLPYIDYELTKKIFDYRDEVAELQSLEELKNIEDFPVENFDKIALYLTAE